MDIDGNLSDDQEREVIAEGVKRWRRSTAARDAALWRSIRKIGDQVALDQLFAAITDDQKQLLREIGEQHGDES